MANADSNKIKMADETSDEQTGVASTESDMECGKVSGTTESGDRPPSVGVTADDIECEASTVEKVAKPEEAVKSATTSKSDVAKDEMECEGKLDEPKCTEIREESIETAEADVESLAHSEWKDEIASEDAAGKPQSENSKKSSKESVLSTDAEEKPAETSDYVSAKVYVTVRVDKLKPGEYESFLPDSGHLAEGSNLSPTDSLSSTSSEPARPESPRKTEALRIASLLPRPFPSTSTAKRQISYDPKTGALTIVDSMYIPEITPSNSSSSEHEDNESSKLPETVTEVQKTSTVSKTDSSSSASSGPILPEDTEPKELARDHTVIDEPKPDSPKHVPVPSELSHVELVMKEAEVVDSEGAKPVHLSPKKTEPLQTEKHSKELSPEEKKSATSVFLGIQPEHSNVESPMEQDESAGMSESMQSDIEEPRSRGGVKRRMKDEEHSDIPSKRLNIKQDEGT